MSLPKNPKCLFPPSVLDFHSSVSPVNFVMPEKLLWHGAVETVRLVCVYLVNPGLRQFHTNWFPQLDDGDHDDDDGDDDDDDDDDDDVDL